MRESCSEDIDAINSGGAPLPNYPEIQSSANKNMKVAVGW
ncbi:hypothetical protein RDI58_024727 [Solanum bulbocastanum]|uniref:Uncharacterized protein n=1 Tax=Solanum bulbocastanum TaxID=147425 RepID=A0AAN8T1S8_SOLBU